MAIVSEEWWRWLHKSYNLKWCEKLRWRRGRKLREGRGGCDENIHKGGNGGDR